MKRLALLVLVFSGCGEPKPLPVDGSRDIHGAWAYMQLFVEEQLKSPKSADFPFGGARDAVTDLGEGRYKVASYVDSENTFGGTVRTHFEGVIRKGDGEWHLESLEFIDRSTGTINRVAIEPTPERESPPTVERTEHREHEPMAPPEKKRRWVRVGKWSGSGPKKTERFQSAHGELEIAWAAKPTTQFPGIVQIFAKGTNPLDLHLAANQTVESQANAANLVHAEAGSYYLDINAANVSWIVEVHDWRDEPEPSPEEETAKPQQMEIVVEPAAAERFDREAWENKAESKLRLAKQFLNAGNKVKGRQWLRAVIDEYAGTAAANTSQEMLEKLD